MVFLFGSRARLLLLACMVLGSLASDTENSEHGLYHKPVLRWLVERAEWAEETDYIHPWKLKFRKEEDGRDDVTDDVTDDDYHEIEHQNGFYFASRYLELDVSDGTKPRIVAKKDIPEGEFLVSVPSDTFLYKQPNNAYNQLHPCDVVSLLTDVDVYNFPDDEDKVENPNYPSIERFVRPFVDSIFVMNTEVSRQTWSSRQVETLSNILGNEMEPKSNTLGLWAETELNAKSTKSASSGFVCQHPNSISSKENQAILDRFYNPDESVGHFHSILRTVLTRGWDHRMVPIYHWLPRADRDTANVVHSKRGIDESGLKPQVRLAKEQRREKEEKAEPVAFRLHSSRSVQKGETITLPYHSIAQELLIRGTVGNEGVDRPLRFWAQTLHDQEGSDFLYGDDWNERSDCFLAWDYYPKTKKVEWIEKTKDTEDTDDTGRYSEILRATQRQVLQSQYIRLRGMQDEMTEFANEQQNDALGRSIYEYYELWMESLGLVLAHSRPARANDAVASCKQGADGEKTCPVDAAPRSSYDTLEQRMDPIDYNRFLFPSYGCEFQFETTTYERVKTPYAELAWSRSYIGGGAIDDDDDDDDDDYERSSKHAQDREQDTCLFLDNTVHSCLSFRPHVHETLIHYPASFLPKGGLKRVLYVGGGDLVLLHELLRYDSIETIIGMELDQMVLRGTFRHYGIQPKFEDERVHWWFGDASKSLSLLPPEEYFGTFDLVLIDLVAEIFDMLRVGEHNELLVDYLAKLLKPEGILVRQEDWPEHNIVDFAKYTVDLNIFGIPHLCSQYYTMASNTIDFSNHERVDHELEGLVWYEPNIGTNDHTSMWGEYRNYLDPPKRICDTKDKTEAPIVLPSRGLFVAIEAENVTMALEDVSLVNTTVSKTLEELGFTKILTNTIPDGSVTNYLIFTFEEGYLALRSYADLSYCSMDLQLWNEVSNFKRAVSDLVETVGGTSTNDSSSSFLITTGGMFGIPNAQQSIGTIVPSPWCQGDDPMSSGTISSDQEFTGLETAVQEMLSSFVGKEDRIVLLLCSSSGTQCRVRDEIDYGTTTVVSFDGCAALKEDDISLATCEAEMNQSLQKQFSTRKIDAIIIDPEVSRELGRIAKKVFVTDPNSYQLMSHDHLVIAPSSVSGTLKNFSSSWRYQLLERFRTDLVEFNPVYHATVAFNGASSTKSWTMGIFRAGNHKFYDHLVSSLGKIRREGTSREVVLLQSKTGTVHYIPDNEPRKWATPSDYDLDPAKKQWSDQQPLGSQNVVQYQKVASTFDKIHANTHVLFYRKESNDWIVGYIEEIYEMNGKTLYKIYEQLDTEGQPYVLAREDVIVYDPETLVAADEIPFGTIVLADGDDNLGWLIFHDAQIIKMFPDGRYRVWYLSDGSYGIIDRERVVPKPSSFFSSSAEAKLFSSCTEFENFLFGGGDDGAFAVFSGASMTTIHRQNIGNGCLVVFSDSREDGDGDTTTIISTYDGQRHVDFNVYKSSGDQEEVMKEIVNLEHPNMSRIQIDSHPRGYGRVVNFEHDLKKNYFGTEHPRAI